jgi:hypothetical protein
MTQDILSIAAPILAGLVVIVTVFVTNYFDENKAKAERKARLADRDHNAAAPRSAAE